MGFIKSVLGFLVSNGPEDMHLDAQTKAKCNLTHTEIFWNPEIFERCPLCAEQELHLVTRKALQIKGERMQVLMEATKGFGAIVAKMPCECREGQNSKGEVVQLTCIRCRGIERLREAIAEGAS